MRPTPRKFERPKPAKPAAPRAKAAPAPVAAPAAPLAAPVGAPVAAPASPPKLKSAGRLLQRPNNPESAEIRFADVATFEKPPGAFELFDGRPRIVCMTLALILFLIPVRGATIGWPLEAIFTSVDDTPMILIASVYDAILAVGLGLLAYVLIWFLRYQPTMQRWTCRLFALVAAAVLAASMANTRIVEILGEPFNYRWLHYSNFFRGVGGRHAIFGWLNVTSLVVGAWGIASMFGVAFVIRWLSRFVLRSITPRDLLFAAIPLFVAYAIFAPWYLITQMWGPKFVANPIVAFAGSVFTSIDTPALFTTATSVPPDDVMTVADRKGAEPSALAAKLQAGGARNVIVVVLEATAAEYTDVYGGGYNVTPNLDRYAKHAAIFDSVYAAAPSARAAVSSMLCSIYPALAYQDITETNPQVSFDALPATMKQHGFRTGFFDADDLNYHGGRELIQKQQFQLVEDTHNRTRDANQSDEQAAVQSMLKWFDAGASSNPPPPVFAMLWTKQTRNPYSFGGAPGKYDKDLEKNRYLTALNQTDNAVGELLDALAQRAMLESTLVIVVGDYGEAFNQHGQRGHGSTIYEETVHVPCMIINPRLFGGEHYKGVGGLVDLAPTICEILNIPQMPRWQGRSLFSRDPNGRAYFAAPWADYLFGYREGDQKVILQPVANRFEVFDLKSDPWEQHDIRKDSTPVIASAQDHLAAWVQYQVKFFEKNVTGRQDDKATRR